MYKRNYLIFLKDIRKCSDKILQFTRGKTFDKFIKDEIISDAVIKNLMIIGEAAKNIPDEVKRKYNDIEWKKIAGFRDVLIHHYFEIDNDILWDIVINKVPELNKKIKKILQKR